jgi:hypothetical protein
MNKVMSLLIIEEKYFKICTVQGESCPGFIINKKRFHTATNNHAKQCPSFGV